MPKSQFAKIVIVIGFEDDMRRKETININTPERYDEIYFGPRRIELRGRFYVGNLLKMLFNGRVLDVGCGIGQYFNYLSECSICGVDFSLKAIDEAKREFPEADVRNCDLRTSSIPYEDNFFDCVFAAEIIEHLECPELLINDIKRVTKDGGLILITTPFEGMIGDTEHLWDFGESDFIEYGKKFSYYSLLRTDNPGNLRGSPAMIFIAQK